MYRQTCTKDDGGSWLVTIAYGMGAEVEMSRVPLVMVGSDPQKQGSALTYAKRYGLCAAFGLAGEEDDDGNAATEDTRGAQKPRKQQPRASTPPKPQQGGTEAPVASKTDSVLAPEDMDTLRQCFVNYRNALGVDGHEALQRLIDETGIESFGETMTYDEFQRAQIAMGKAIARASGAKVVE